MSGLVAPQVYVKAVGEVRNVFADLTGVLSTTETISSTTALVVTDATSGLSFGTISPTTAGLTINGTTVAAGQAVQFSVAGGTSGNTYYMRVVAPTSLGQTLYRFLQLRVRGNTEP